MLENGKFRASKSDYKDKIKIEFFHRGITFNEIHLNKEEYYDLVYLSELVSEEELFK